MIDHNQRIRDVFDVAKQAGARGDAPFGALLISADGDVMAEAGNSQVSNEQVLAHAEMVLLHDAVKQFSKEELAGATIYTSAEPCAMCSGAIFWSGVGRLVFGISGAKLHAIAGHDPNILVASSREVLSRAGRQVEVVGPVLEEEAAALFKD